MVKLLAVIIYYCIIWFLCYKTILLGDNMTIKNMHPAAPVAAVSIGHDNTRYFSTPVESGGGTFPEWLQFSALNYGKKANLPKTKGFLDNLPVSSENMEQASIRILRRLRGSLR